MGPDELSRWRDGLLVDREDTLIGAAKRWLGPVKTPFNKHELIARLEAFLRKAATAEAIIGLMDRVDRRLVALVLYSGRRPGDGVPASHLVALAADERSGEGAAVRRIRSLRDRLILYGYRDARGLDMLAIAPPLLASMQAALEPSDALTIMHPAMEPDAPDPFASFCAVVSACSHAKPAFKGRREPSKKVLEILGSASPALAADRDRFNATIGVLESAGIFRQGDEGRPVVDPRRFVELCETAGAAAPLAIAASSLVSESVGPELAPGLLRAALEALPRGAAVGAGDIRRVIAMAVMRHLLAHGTAGGTVPLATLQPNLNDLTESIMSLLGAIGAVLTGDDGLVRSTAAIDGLLAKRQQAARCVVIEESHELKILPEAGPGTRAFIASVARLERTGLVWSAVLDKSAAKAGYAYGFRASELRLRLEELSGTPLPQSVAFSLDAWESEARSARVRVGVVVALDGHLSGVLEHSPKAAGIVLERLAEGVYMLAARNATEAEHLLRSAGIDVDIRPSAPALDDGAMSHALWSAAESAFLADTSGPALAFLPQRTTLVAAEPPLVTTLLARLEELDLPPDEKADLADRIRSRLVLDEDQLRQPSPDGDGLVVGAMDYPGKLRLIERAMKEGSTIDIAYTDADGAQTSAIGVPREVRRSSDGMIVTVHVGGGITAVIPASTMGKVRLLRNSIFGEQHEYE